MIRQCLALVLLAACAAPQTPSHPPRQLARKPSSPLPDRAPPPPPPPDSSYAAVPEAIATILNDPAATIEILVLTSDRRPGETFRGFSIVRRESLRGLQRDRVAVVLTSAVTYGHVSNLCSSAGIGFHLSSPRAGTVNVWIDPSEGRVEILGSSPQSFALSMSGVRLFSDLSHQFQGEGGCG